MGRRARHLGLVFDGYDLAVHGTVVSTFLRDPSQIGRVTRGVAGHTVASAGSSTTKPGAGVTEQPQLLAKAGHNRRSGAAPEMGIGWRVNVTAA
jgi:hypothetical protein